MCLLLFYGHISNMQNKLVQYKKTQEYFSFSVHIVGKLFQMAFNVSSEHLVESHLCLNFIARGLPQFLSQVTTEVHECIMESNHQSKHQDRKPIVVWVSLSSIKSGQLMAASLSSLVLSEGNLQKNHPIKCRYFLCIDTISTPQKFILCIDTVQHPRSSSYALVLCQHPRSSFSPVSYFKMRRLWLKEAEPHP